MTNVYKTIGDIIAVAAGIKAHQAAKNRANLEKSLRYEKPTTLTVSESWTEIIGILCPSCNQITEEGQWFCHMCGADLITSLEKSN